MPFKNFVALSILGTLLYPGHAHAGGMLVCNFSNGEADGLGIQNLTSLAPSWITRGNVSYDLTLDNIAEHAVTGEAINVSFTAHSADQKYQISLSLRQVKADTEVDTIPDGVFVPGHGQPISRGSYMPGQSQGHSISTYTKTWYAGTAKVRGDSDSFAGTASCELQDQ